jgi:hypothetical protein
MGKNPIERERGIAIKGRGFAFLPLLGHNLEGATSGSIATQQSSGADHVVLQESRHILQEDHVNAFHGSAQCLGEFTHQAKAQFLTCNRRELRIGQDGNMDVALGIDCPSRMGTEEIAERSRILLANCSVVSVMPGKKPAYPLQRFVNARCGVALRIRDSLFGRGQLGSRDP